MKALDILQERNVKKSEFAQILADDTIKIGFECEMALSHELSSGTDPDELNWDDLKTYLNLNQKDERAIDEEFDSWLNDEVNTRWYNASSDFTYKYCKDAGLLDDDNGDEFEDEGEIRDIMDEHEQEAREEWDATKRPTIEKEFDMDDFIRDKYGSNREFIDQMQLEPKHGFANGGSLYHADPAEGGGTLARHNAAEDITELMGQRCRVFDAYHETIKNTESWYIEPDGSIQDVDGVPAEVVSPIFDLMTGLTAMQKLFDWMIENGHNTAKSTGLHITLSREGVNAGDYDFLKMLIFFDENFTAHLFSRLGNTYCAQMRSKLISMIQDHHMDEAGNKIAANPAGVITSRDMPGVLKALKAVGNSLQAQWDKDASIHSRKNGAFEFRGMGGEDYQHEFDTIRSRVVNMASILRLGSDPTLMAREYITKVFALLGGGKYAGSKLGSGAQTIEVPRDLYAFDAIFKRFPIFAGQAGSEPIAFLKNMADLMIKQMIPDMTSLQRKQLYAYVIRRKYTAETLRYAFGNDKLYNAIAAMMRWPLAVEGEKNQGVLPFAQRNRDAAPKTPWVGPTYGWPDRHKDQPSVFSDKDAPPSYYGRRDRGEIMTTPGNSRRRITPSG